MRTFWKIFYLQCQMSKSIFANFGKKRVEINSVESVDNPKPNPPSNKQTINPIIAEIQTLKTSIDSLSSWKDDFEKRDKRFKSRLSKQRDTLPRRCPNCVSEFHRDEFGTISGDDP